VTKSGRAEQLNRTRLRPTHSRKIVGPALQARRGAAYLASLPGAARNTTPLPPTVPGAEGAGGQPGSGSELRRRVATELALISAGAALFLRFGPHDLFVYLGLASLAGAAVALSAKQTRERIWGPVPLPRAVRLRRSAAHLAVLTLPVALLLLACGLYLYGPSVLRLGVLFTFAFYLPWALLQQTLFQFYLLGRLRVLFPLASPLLLSVVDGLLYGMTHFPSGWLLAGLTVACGIVWSYCYHRDRVLLPVAVSHAVLGTAFFCWAMNGGFF
jgi:membrane protease YdiL (CAAX protease family)